MYFVKNPRWFRFFYPKATWHIYTSKKELYLTFDDGPIPEVTPWVLEQLKNYEAKATFFGIGENIEKNPELFEQIITEGHSIGNHTYNHLNGWETDKNYYLQNMTRCTEVMDASTLLLNNSTTKQHKLFRPPYGKLTPFQYSALCTRYSIIMWDILSGDFDKNISKEKCLDNVVKNAQNGSIIVFHDSLKAKEKLTYVLPKTLEYFSQKGYTFNSIPIAIGTK